jgi:hypothetical protein
VQTKRCSPKNALLLVLSAIRKLPQAVLVDVVDLLADGTSRQLGVVGGDHHAAMSFATHGCSEASYAQLDCAMGVIYRYRYVDAVSCLRLAACRVPCMDELELGSLELSPHHAKWVSAVVSMPSDPLR